jgi:hypothetical protein
MARFTPGPARSRTGRSAAPRWRAWRGS